MDLDVLALKVNTSERPMLIDKLFTALEAHLMDEARNMRGDIVENDPVAAMTNTIANLHKDYKEKYA